MTTHPIVAIVVEDDALACRAVCRPLKRAGIRVVGTYVSAEAALAEIERTRPTVALVDYDLPGQCGIDLIRALKRRMPGLKCIFFTGYDDRSLQMRAVMAGARGILKKPVGAQALIATIRTVAEGGTVADCSSQDNLFCHICSCASESSCEVVTPSELAVLQLRAEGNSYKEIAAIQMLKEETIHSHLRNAYRKLGASRTKEAIAILGLVSGPGARTRGEPNRDHARSSGPGCTEAVELGPPGPKNPENSGGGTSGVQ